MAAQYMPKTLAKTLSYIAYHAPGEYGLFWDPNGTMPWKEYYWALQEDESLRFVREAHVREIGYLGIEMKFALEGSTLRLKDGIPLPKYSVETPPDRLYYACKRRQYDSIKEHGISASGRSFLALGSNRELAVRMGQRRDPKPLLMEIAAKKAAEGGINFLKAGTELYLVESIPIEFLILPVLRADQRSQTASQKKKEQAPWKIQLPHVPGSFFMEPKHLENSMHDSATPADRKAKGKRGAEWKREARKERTKRNI
ncbi:MAG: RNA 2'-phosphotransferase [Syntrophobacteraceae bacterium]